MKGLQGEKGRAYGGDFSELRFPGVPLASIIHSFRGSYSHSTYVWLQAQSGSLLFKYYKALMYQ